MIERLAGFSLATGKGGSLAGGAGGKKMEVHSVEAVVAALNEARVEFLIVGGLAVNAHGFVRLTRDIDIVLRLSAENAAKGLNALLAIGYQMAIPEKPESFAQEAIRERWRVEKNMVVLKLWSDVHRRTPIDIFVYEPFPFAEEMAKSVRLEISPGVTAPVVTLETLLAMKRFAGRPQDLIDITELERIR